MPADDKNKNQNQGNEDDEDVDTDNSCSDKDDENENEKDEEKNGPPMKVKKILMPRPPKNFDIKKYAADFKVFNPVTVAEKLRDNN